MKQYLSKIFIFSALFFGSPSLALSDGHLPRCSQTKASASKAVRCILVEKWDGVWDKNLWIGEAYWDAEITSYPPSRDIGVWIKNGKIHKEGKFSNAVSLEKAFKTPYSSPPYYFPSSKLKKLFATYSQIERKSIQTNLAFHGYYKSKIDGLYGKGTAAAMKAYNEEYLGNADLTKSWNVNALFDDLLRDQPTDEEAKPKVKVTLNLGSGGLKVELGSGEAPTVEDPVAPPLDFAKVKASYDAGNFSQAFREAQTLSVEGNPDAQLYLGKMYADGRGTLQVTTSAHMWFNIASMNGSDEAFEERKAIQTQMTPELINEAQKMAFACIKSDYKDCGVLVQPSEAKVVKEREPYQKPFQPTSSELRGFFVSQSTLQRKQIQYALKKLGYYRSSVDGLWGKGTKRAVEGYLNADSSINSLDGIYASLTAQVAVPNSFAASKQTVSTAASSSSSPKSYYKDMKPIVSNPSKPAQQAWAICDPQARIALNEAQSSRQGSVSSGFNCKTEPDVLGGSRTRCRETSSSGGWPGLIPLLLEIDPASQAKRTGERAYSATMDYCLAKYGWKKN